MAKRRRRAVRSIRSRRPIRTVRPSKRNAALRKRSNPNKQLAPVRKSTKLSRRPRIKAVGRRRPSIANISLMSPEGKSLLSRNQWALSVIISVHNEESTIRQLLEQTMHLWPKEIIVVENGSTDRTLEICREYPVRVFSYPHRLGHDVGRAIGAREATGEVLLFLDGDLLIEPSLLLPFVKACYNGADIAVNNLDPFYENISVIDQVSMSKYYLNSLMSRRDLGFCSLTAVPHAMKKSAVLAIGVENLAVPPKAQAIALYQGLRVDKAATIDVIFTNKMRPYHNAVAELILGDHVEAIHWLQERTSNRIRFAESGRLRFVAQEER